MKGNRKREAEGVSSKNSSLGARNEEFLWGSFSDFSPLLILPPRLYQAVIAFAFAHCSVRTFRSVPDLSTGIYCDSHLEIDLPCFALLHWFFCCLVPLFLLLLRMLLWHSLLVLGDKSLPEARFNNVWEEKLSEFSSRMFVFPLEAFVSLCVQSVGETRRAIFFSHLRSVRRRRDFGEKYLPG